MSAVSEQYSRIAIITNGNYFAAITLAPTIAKYRKQICLGIIITGDYHGRSGKGAVWALFKEMTFPYFVYKVMTVVLPKLLARFGAGSVTEVAALLKQAEIEQISDAKVDAERVRRSLAEAQPDIIVSVSCPQKIRGNLISLARRAAINIHSSLLPRYAGLAPYFWVLSRGEAETGVTVHHMTEKFDAGNVLTQRRVPVRPGVSAFALFEELARAGGEGLVTAIEAAARGCVGEEQCPAERSYFSHPTFRSYLELRRRGHRLIALSDLSSFVRSAIRGSAAGPRPAQPSAPLRPERANTGGHDTRGVDIASPKPSRERLL
jgi:folate-dependent phosphoribosylglycinamide formyltransferase PurN